LNIGTGRGGGRQVLPGKMSRAAVETTLPGTAIRT
jgi:hypothetical protein